MTGMGRAVAGEEFQNKLPTSAAISFSWRAAWLRAPRGRGAGLGLEVSAVRHIAVVHAHAGRLPFLTSKTNVLRPNIKRYGTASTTGYPKHLLT